MSQNVIDANGIQIQTLADIINDIINGTANVPGLIQIYGAGINTASNTPDGQLINIFALSKLDIENFIVQDYNSKDPDQAVGVALDGIAQLCGLARKGGTYTQTPVTVTTSGSVSLNGLDTSTPYTVSDNAGNLFYLIASAVLTTGANVLEFQAAKIGAVQVVQNTITIPISIIPGVTSVNNPSVPDVTGVNQETDSQFRIRRQKSVSAPSQGYLQSLYGGLNNIVNLNNANVYENNTNVTNGDGVPGHSIWVVVNGGSNADVSRAIYNYRNAGCGMYGAVNVNITQVDGSIFVVSFDRAVPQNLYLTFHLDTINAGTIDNTAIKNFLVANWIFGIYQEADITTMSDLIRQANSNVVVSAAGVSNDGITYDVLSYPPSKKNQYVLTANHITIT
jgi:hypothetical protein